jgi:predicted alpha/beta-hydrolase family hydrolase
MVWSPRGLTVVTVPASLRVADGGSRFWSCLLTIGFMQQTTGKSAVIAPGGGYGPDGPLLMFAGYAVECRGGITQVVEWDFSDSPDDAQLGEQVVRKVGGAVSDLMADTGAAPLVIGKSLGSRAASLVADRGLAAVWFTPLLTSEQTVAALCRATAPALLIGGTADKFWDRTLARSLSPHVVEVADADHRMFVPGPLAASAAVLGEVISAVEHFLDKVVWP